MQLKFEPPTWGFAANKEGTPGNGLFWILHAPANTGGLHILENQPIEVYLSHAKVYPGLPRYNRISTYYGKCMI